jgi:hypothetical protein
VAQRHLAAELVGHMIACKLHALNRPLHLNLGVRPRLAAFTYHRLDQRSAVRIHQSGQLNSRPRPGPTP